MASTDAAAHSNGRTAEDDARLRRQGAVVLVGFGLLWALVGSSGIASDGTRTFARGVAAAAAIALLVGTRRVHLDVAERRLPVGWRRTVGRVNLGQLAAIGTTVAVSVGSGRPELVPPTVCLIVGMHFIPLAHSFAQPQYRITGLGLCVLSIVGYGGLSISAALSRGVVGVGAAVVLWATAIHVLTSR